jgi:hypothetical protein
MRTHVASTFRSAVEHRSGQGHVRKELECCDPSPSHGDALTMGQRTVISCADPALDLATMTFAGTPKLAAPEPACSRSPRYDFCVLARGVLPVEADEEEITVGDLSNRGVTAALAVKVPQERGKPDRPSNRETTVTIDGRGNSEPAGDRINVFTAA